MYLFNQESRNNPVVKINFIQVCFCKTTNKLKPDISLCCNFMFVKAQFSISLLSQHCAYGLVRLRHRSHLVRVRKTSLFGLEYQVLVAKNVTGNAPSSPKNCAARKNSLSIFSRVSLSLSPPFFCLLLSCSKHSSPLCLCLILHLSFSRWLFCCCLCVRGRKSDGSGSRWHFKEPFNEISVIFLLFDC